VLCVDEVLDLFAQYRDIPPDPAIVAALRGVLARGTGIGAIPRGTWCRPHPLPDKEIEP
jgi:hypothetical protein